MLAEVVEVGMDLVVVLVVLVEGVLDLLQMLLVLMQLILLVVVEVVEEDILLHQVKLEEMVVQEL
jgi:hypothetical protein